MNIIHRISAGIAVVMTVVTALATTAFPAQAQTLSPGCQLIHANSSTNWTGQGVKIGSPMDFYAGETLVLNPTSAGTYALEVPEGTIIRSGSGQLTYTFPVDVSMIVLFRITSTSTGGSLTIDCLILPPAKPNEFGQTAGTPCQGALDGRINGVSELDCAPPFAIYNEGDYFALYGVNPETGKGELVVRVMKADIGETPAENTLLAEGVNVFTGQPVTVWHLSSGELQVNATYADGKPYVFTFDADGNLIAHLAA